MPSLRRSLRVRPVRVAAAALVSLLSLQSCGGGGSSDDPAAPDAPTYLVGGSVGGLESAGLVLRRNATETVEVAADGSFTFPTPLRSGERYEVVIAQQPTRISPRQVCAVANGSGVVGAAPVRDIVVSCRDMTARFLYVVVEGAVSIQAFSIDPASGALAEIQGSPFFVGGPARSLFIAASPDERFLYVFGSDGLTTPPTQVSVLRIDAGTGRLSAVPGGSLSITGLVRTRPVFLRSGRAMYLGVGDSRGSAGAANRVLGFAVDPDSGTLEGLPGSPYALPGDSAARDAVLSAADDQLYVAYGTLQGSVVASAGVAAFSVNPEDASLLQRSQADLGFVPASLARHPGGRHLYAGGTGALATLSIERSGDLALRSEVPGWEAPLVGTVALRFASSGRQAYLWSSRPISAGDAWINDIGVFDVDSENGALTEVTGSRVGAAGTWSMTGLVAEPRGRFLIGARFPTSAPTPVPGQSWNVWAIDPGSGRLSVAEGSPTVSRYDAENIPGFALDPSGRFLFSADYVSDTVRSYRIDMTSGAVAVADEESTGVLPRGVLAVGLQ